MSIETAADSVGVNHSSNAAGTALRCPKK